MRYLDKLSEAKKRGYTYQEVDAYARGREKATIARRKKEFEDFKDEVIRKSKEEKKKKVEEARTIPRKKGGGFEKKTTSPDRRVAPTEKALEGEGLSRAEYRKRMMKKLKAEAYIQLGDVLAEGMRVKVADALKKFSRKQYRKGEVDDASGKPKRAKMRGKAANMAGKLAQKVEPKEKG